MPEIGLPTADPVTCFRDWLANEGAPFWSFWENAGNCWAIRDLSNVHFVHFADLKSDMDGEIRKIAAFLDITPSDWQTVLDHCTFDYMKPHAGDCVPLGGAFWEGGAQTFLYKGTNGRWQGVARGRQCCFESADAAGTGGGLRGMEANRRQDLTSRQSLVGCSFPVGSDGRPKPCATLAHQFRSNDSCMLLASSRGGRRNGIEGEASAVKAVDFSQT